MRNKYDLMLLAEKYKLYAFADLFNFIKPAEAFKNNTYTDGKYIYVQEDFFELDEDTQLFYVCHEALHIIYEHIKMLTLLDDKGEEYFKDKELLNICQDVIINEKLSKLLGYQIDRLIYYDNLHTIFKKTIIWGLYNFVPRNRLTTTKLYDYLIEKFTDNELSKIKSQVKNDFNVGDTMKNIARDISNQECQAPNLNEHNMQGYKQILKRLAKDMKLSDASFKNEAHQPTIIMDEDDETIFAPNEHYEAGTQDGKEITMSGKKEKIISTKEIIKFIENYIGNQVVIKGRSRTYNRPNRRLQSDVNPLRGSKPYKHIKKLSIYLDTSGSMSSKFVSDMYETLKLLHKKVNFNFYSFDTSVYEVNFIMDKLMIGGGTSIDKVLRHINDNKFDVTIMITDCEDSFDINTLNGEMLLFTDNKHFTNTNPKVSVNFWE